MSVPSEPLTSKWPEFPETRWSEFPEPAQMGGRGTWKAWRPPSHLLLGAAGGAFYMLYLYAKNEQGDLTVAQIRTLARLVREESR